MDPLNNDLPYRDELALIFFEKSENKAFSQLFLNLTEAIGCWGAIEHMGLHQFIFILWQHTLGKLYAIVRETVVNLRVQHVVSNFLEEVLEGAESRPLRGKLVKKGLGQ